MKTKMTSQNIRKMVESSKTLKTLIFNLTFVLPFVFGADEFFLKEPKQEIRNQLEKKTSFALLGAIKLDKLLYCYQICDGLVCL